MRRPAILFVHDDHPGQFGALARHLQQRGWSVAFATAAPGPDGASWPVIRYRPHRTPAAATHPYAQGYERAALNGQACLRALIAAGLPAPAIVVSHAGPGAGLYLRDLYPDSHVVAYCEWWYGAPGPDLTFLAGIEGRAACDTAEARILARARNLPVSAELLAADRGLCPTGFQAAQFPDALRRWLTVRHDGVDAEFFSPCERHRRPRFGTVPDDTPLVTCATRGMEPYRGFPQVIRALRLVLDRRPDWQAAIAGSNRVFYGSDSDRRTDWQAWAVETLGPVAPRVHFTGPLPRDAYRDLLRRSDAHVHATIPFVLSWSLIEAMATGAPLVASATAPVLEVLDAAAARLFDAASPADLAAAIVEAVDDPGSARIRAAEARARAVAGFAAARLLPEHEQWLLEGI